MVDLVSGLEDVSSAADDATDALEAMEQAAEDAAEAASQVGGFRYGGSFLSKAFRMGGSFFSPRMGFQHGGSFISTHEQNFKGRRISELNKWEMVTVIPLSNPNDATDKNSLFPAPARLPASIGAGVAGGGAGGGLIGGAGGPIIVQGNITSVITLPDGRVLAHAVNPFLMDGQDQEL